MTAGPAWAQDAASDAGAGADTASVEAVDAIVVTGIRASLANAQAIKKNSDTVVDAITASDIGALPDRSVTEALQRVPGVSINRFASAGDPDHFSVEGSGVVVRGLNFVRSEFNGRDAFAAGGYGQGIGFADVPAELLGSVEVYKNATADMIEGGLAGTVNLNTRKPFDNKGFHMGMDMQANYGDMAKKWTPTGSILISDTWETGAGTFGLLADVSYSRIRSRADGLQVTNYQTRDGSYTLSGNGSIVCRNPLPSDSDDFGTPSPVAYGTGGFAAKPGDACYEAAAAGADGNADFASTRYAPLGGQFRRQNFDRKRDGVALAGQFETADRAAVFTAQYLRSHSTNAWKEHTFESGSDLSEYNTYPVGCQTNLSGAGTSTQANCPVGGFTNYTYDDGGLFQSGYITNPGGAWRGSPFDSIWVPLGGMQQNVASRQVFEEVTNQDFGLNGKIDFDDHWHLDLDFDYTKSVRNNTDISLIGGHFADEELDLTGSLPVITPHKPNALFYDWAQPLNLNPELAAMSDAEYFQSPNTQFWRAVMDHHEHSTGSEYAARADLSYQFDEGSFLKEMKVGARYADRSQVVRYASYNWGMLSETWSGAHPISVATVGGDSVSFDSFPNFFRGQTSGPAGGWYYNGDMISDYSGLVDFASRVQAESRAVGGQPTWTSSYARPGVNADGFLPSEIQPVTQRDFNAYVMTRFGSDIGTVRMSGNIGVRYVHTNVVSDGSVNVPTAQALNLATIEEDQQVLTSYSDRCGLEEVRRPDGSIVLVRQGGVCTLDEAAYNALQTWAGTGSDRFDRARNSYSYLLPSLNLKFGLTNDLIIRFAASKVLTRPQNDYIRNFLTIGLAESALSATAGNPYLKPATAWQFDLTAEWYFARVGSLTFDVFYKDVKNFFYQNVRRVDIESNGVTQSVIVRGPENYSGHGKIKGFEVAYQHTFDFLPGLLSGFGVNANYTYISSKGLPNSFLNGSGLAQESTVPPGNLPLEQLSKHNINVAAFYEKGPISLRAAYNWRSRFLLTASDVVFPHFAIFNEPTGQLDASAFVNITKQIKIGVQGVNLLNEVTRTSQAYTGDPGKLAPRSYFMNDRRFSFILRGNF
ncbi:TonB-dependent receptor [Novosphingobium endophyticum]|uniref:TonB-dependent receptor n=2 Tax=Novosphingobium endophyticum TaxID=1955250 RepID=A0A916TSI3_9SPHN|nr:TonB-dependent receptor [Novosphingobium endophyticum]